jgi:hypothetical protein
VGPAPLSCVATFVLRAGSLGNRTLEAQGTLGLQEISSSPAGLSCPFCVITPLPEASLLPWGLTWSGLLGDGLRPEFCHC